MNEFSIRLLAHEHCDTGESPVWDAARRCLYWIDIPAGKVFRHDFDAGMHTCIYTGECVGGICLQADGGLLLFRVRDIALLPVGGPPRVVVEYTDPGLKRFNDVFVEPAGRVFVGTIGNSDEDGGLYRVDWNGTITKVAGGTGCANGSAISPDGATFFWTDSTNQQILRFDYDADRGDLRNPRQFCEIPKEEGIPDGMCMDADGNLWSARWHGGALVKIDPRGEVVHRLKMPVKTPSCPCFGGEKLDRLYVTTAEGKAGAENLDGALFEVAGVSPGVPASLSRILL